MFAEILAHFSSIYLEQKIATFAFRLNHSQSACEYIEAISVNMRLCSASLSCPVMENEHSEHLTPERIKTDWDLMSVCLLTST